MNFPISNKIAHESDKILEYAQEDVIQREDNISEDIALQEDL